MIIITWPLRVKHQHEYQVESWDKASVKSCEYLKVNHGCQVFWNLSTLPLSCASVSSISQTSQTLFSHSKMEGTLVEFQCRGISDLAALRRCLVKECLYRLNEKFVTCKRQQAAFKFSLVSVILLIRSLIFVQ